MPVALVTGATGLVGAAIAERLLRDGWSVRVLVRDPAGASWLRAAGAEPVKGDLLDERSLTAGARECNVVFHCAALVLSGEGFEAYRRANVEGTLNAVRAAAANGARLLHLSSVAVYGASGRYRARPTDEDTPLPPITEGAAYGRTKRESELLVLEAHARGEVWATAVRPDVIYGRRDRHFTPRIGRLMRTGFFPRIGSGNSTLAMVQADNVADGAILAVGNDRAGGRAYNLANDYDVTVREFAHLAGEGLGHRVRLLPIPLHAAALGARATLGAIGLVRGRNFVQQATGSIDFLSRDNPFSSARARTELGWSPPVKPEVGIPEAFRWWREHG